MTRAFTTQPVDRAIVDHLIDLARRGPTAGNTAGLDWLVLATIDEVGAYWDTTLPLERRNDFPWPRLLDAPVLIIPWVDPEAYVARYAEPDKVLTGLGGAAGDWMVPYWFVDGGAAAMTLLLGAEDAGLGALLFGLFEHEDAVRARFGVPASRRAVGAIALGHRAPDCPSLSARRGRPRADQIVHRGVW